MSQIWTEEQAVLSGNALRAPAGFLATKRPLQHAIINVTVAGNTDIIPPTPGYLIEIWGVTLWNATVEQTIRLLAGDKLVMRLTSFPSRTGTGLVQGVEPHFRLEEGEAFRISLTDLGFGVGQVDGFVNYRKIIR